MSVCVWSFKNWSLYFYGFCFRRENIVPKGFTIQKFSSAEKFNRIGCEKEKQNRKIFDSPDVCCFSSEIYIQPDLFFSGSNETNKKKTSSTKVILTESYQCGNYAGVKCQKWYLMQFVKYFNAKFICNVIERMILLIAVKDSA